MFKNLLKKKGSSMFREFIYLDMDRVQSIGAQLNEGLLTDTTSGRQKEVTGKAGTPELLAHLFPLTAEAQGKYATDIKENRILHDFAFSLAFKSLQREELVLEDVDEYERASFPATETAFILTRGRPKLYDFSTLQRLWDKKWNLDHESNKDSGRGGKGHRFSSRQQQRLGEDSEPTAVRAFFDTFYNDVVLVSLANKSSVTFMGLLYRKHLREDIRSLIFKYGARPQGNWAMLAQICSIPERKEKSVDNETARISEALDTLSIDPENINWSQFITDLLERSNEFQEQMGTVMFPTISVSPIALYREVVALP